jgi:tetratricopeptide (TPR) repeat protein
MSTQRIQVQASDGEIGPLIGLLQAGRFDELERQVRILIALYPGHGLLYKIFGAARQMQGMACLNELRRAALLSPGDIELYSNLGNLLRVEGHLSEAHTCLERALAWEPTYVYALYNLGLLMHDSGEYVRAERCLQRALTIEPFASQVHLALGDLQQDSGRMEDALRSYRKTLVIEPDAADAHLNAGNVFATLHQWQRAERCYRHALDIQPESADAHCNLGMVLVEEDRSVEAITHLQRATAIHPLHAQAHNNLGNAFYVQGRFAEAIASYRFALIIEPDYAEAYANLGNALDWNGQLSAAHRINAWALAINPHNAKAHNNLGNVLRELGNTKEAITSFERSLAIAPSNAETRLNYSFSLLEQGDFARGWREYESRWQTKIQGRLPDLGIPQWRGETDIKGKTLLLYAEQGFGDTIQFIRYASLLAERGAVIHIAVPEQLLTLSASCPGVTATWRLQEVFNMQPRADFICPMMSLPLACDTTPENIPAALPYLRASAVTDARWRDVMSTLANTGNALRVGLVWSGNPRKHMPLSNAIDRQRSMSFDQISPVLDIASIDFFSLQVVNDKSSIAIDKRLIDLTHHIQTFEDTAALVSQLDLVISVDTAVAHLVGAIGKPIWMLNRFNTCWRWMRDRDDNTWYPSMKIYRQSSPGNWSKVIEQVAADLKSLVQSITEE